MSERNKHWGEVFLVASGAGLLLALPLVAFTESFFVWAGAKALYGIGVLLFLVNK